MKILKKIKRIKILIRLLEETKSLDDAIEIQIIKKEISKLSRVLWDLQKLDTTSLKYRCDAVSDSMGHAIANISKENYTNIFEFNYKRWIERCSNDELLSPSTKRLMLNYNQILTVELKQLCSKHNEKRIYSELNKEDQIIFDKFVKIGCDTLISLYEDFERKIKD